MLRYQCTTHLCQAASGKNSAALSASPMQASEVISRIPFNPRSLRCLRNSLQPLLSSFAPSQMPRISKAERPASHLEAFRGVLQVDGYAGGERLTERGDIVLAACWAHTRRKFFDVHESTGSPIAAEALRRVTELYAIEKSIQGRTAEERRSVRDT